MVINEKRPLNHHPSPPKSIPDPTKRRLTSSTPVSTLTQSHSSSPQEVIKRPTSAFPSYRDAPTLPPNVKLLCGIIATTHSQAVEKVLEDSGIRVTQEDVEEVLKFSYRFPGSAVKFFRWSGILLNDLHSPYAWNLVVDILGKNCLFDAMWDAVKSMKKLGLVSLATFASVFGSYASADRVKDAIMTFDVMDQYGSPRDVVALNSLLSAICREGKTVDAFEFFQIAKHKITPDRDSYAILLEGWEIEGNAIGAKETFKELVAEMGWDPTNVPAYESFLCALLKGPDGINEALKFFATLRDRGCYPGKIFLKVALDKCAKEVDFRAARLFWEVMVGGIGIHPDTQMYNSMIALHCYHKDTDTAQVILDEMVYSGIFPDSQSYNVLLRFLIKERKLGEVLMLFNEMIRNDFVPDQSNCTSAVRIFLNGGEHYMAIKVWKYMVETFQPDSDLEETGNMLILGLQDLNRVPEALKNAENMISRKIKVKSSTMSKLKHALAKAGREFAYEELLRKWKSH